MIEMNKGDGGGARGRYYIPGQVRAPNFGSQAAAQAPGYAILPDTVIRVTGICQGVIARGAMLPGPNIL